MRIPSGVTDQYIYFVAVDATDFVSREPGFSSFTVYRSRNGGTSTAMTTPTINETDATNMPGVYELLLDEDMTIDSGDDSQAMVFHITHAGMAPVTREIELYRPKITAGNTLDVTAGGAAGIDLGNVENPTTTLNLSGTTVNLVNTLTTYTGNTPQTGDSFARIGVNGAGLTALPWNAAWDAEVQSECADALTAYGAATGGQISTLNNLSAAQVNAEVDAALADIHLDHLLAVTYDPASKPGAADALLNELVESESGVARFTANALEQAPSGTGASAASIVAAMFTVDTGETEADAVAGSVVYEIVQNAGGGAGLDAAGVRDAIGMAAANFDTQIGNIPTVTAFNARTIASADYATSSALSSVGGVVDGIVTQIGVNGAGLTNINLPDQVMNITGNITGNVSGSVGSVTGSVGSVTGAVTVGTNNDKTGYSMAGAIQTLDALDIAQDSQHSTTRDAIGALNDFNPATDNVAVVTSVTNRVTANVDQIAGNATAATNLSLSARGIVNALAVTGTLSTTQMTTDLTEATSDHYIGRIIVWITGALAGQATDITGYTGSTKLLTFTETTEAPANGDQFVIV